MEIDSNSPHHYHHHHHHHSKPVEKEYLGFRQVRYSKRRRKFLIRMLFYALSILAVGIIVFVAFIYTHQ